MGNDFSDKKAVLLSCYEEKTAEIFDGIRFSFEKTMAPMKVEIVGEFLIPKISDVGEIKNTDGEEQARKLARKFF